MEFYSFSMALMKSNENKRIQLYASGNKKKGQFYALEIYLQSCFYGSAVDSSLGLV